MGENCFLHYPIVVHKDSDSDYGVIVPDIPGCFSTGSTYEDALNNAREAIECHIEGMLLDGEPIPTACEVDQHLKKAEYKGGIWALIKIDLSQISGKAKRINITLPERVLNLIEIYAKNHAMKNRSAFIADATISYIARADRH